MKGRRYSVVALSLLMAAAWTSAQAQEQTVGLFLNEEGAYQGYTLYTPLRSTDSVLLNMKGEVVHKWVSKHWPSNSVYLLPNGNLMRSGKMRGNEMFGERGPSGGRSRRCHVVALWRALTC